MTYGIRNTVATDFADTWCGQLTVDLARKLNCAEVEALAALLRELNADQAADEWIEAHAYGDDAGDDHYRGPIPDEQSLAEDGARWTPESNDTAA